MARSSARSGPSASPLRRLAMVRRSRRPWLAATLGMVTVLLLAVLRLYDPYPVVALRNIAFDTYLRLWRQPAGAPAIRVVDVDEASLADIGQWPWPRDELARLTHRLTEMGASAIAFDMLFAEPDRLSPSRLAASAGAKTPAAAADLADYDREFARALQNAPTVLGFAAAGGKGGVTIPPKTGLAISGGDPKDFVPRIGRSVTSLPEFMAAAKGLGSINLEPGGSVSVVRKLPLLWSDGTRVFPSLALAALRVALGVGTIVVMTDDDGAVQGIRLGSLDIPTTASGALTLTYPRPAPDLVVSARDILGSDAVQNADLISGDIVLVGAGATGLADIKGTPLGVNMPGVDIHALALAQILKGDYLMRNDWVGGLELLAFVVIGLAIVVVILRSGPLACLFVGGGLAIAVVAATALAYLWAGVQVDPSFPLVGGFVVYSAMIFFQFVIADADKRLVRAAFGQYVSPELLHRIEHSRDALRLGGETRELTVMFSDIRNFTTLSESLDPEHLVTVLNTLFGALGAEITATSGTIDKFIGDAIMAFWNAPLDVPDHAAKAVEAALAMRQALRHLNRDDAFGLGSRPDGAGTLAIGIGLSTGEALVGNLGLETRFDYSCVGDTVNVASRVEGACKPVGYDIVASETTRRAAASFAWLEAGAIALKGKALPERTFILLGDADYAASAEFAALAAAHAAALAALAAGGSAEREIAVCLERVPQRDANLAGFYARLADRRSDFVPGRPET